MEYFELNFWALRSIYLALQLQFTEVDGQIYKLKKKEKKGKRILEEIVVQKVKKEKQKSKIIPAQERIVSDASWH